MFDLNSFVSENIPFIKKYAECFNMSHHDAEDIASTVICDFVKKFNNGRINLNQNLKAYLSQLTRWRIQDKARANIKSSNMFQQIGEENDLDDLPLPEQDKKDFRKVIKLALKTVYKNKQSRKNKCSDRDCEIFRLSILEEMSADDIASKLKTSKSVVYLARHRVGKQIQNTIKEWNLNLLL